MKKKLLLLFLNVLLLTGYGQKPADKIAGKKSKLSAASADSTRVRLFTEIASDYRFTNTDSALHYANNAIELSRSIRFTAGEANALTIKGFILLEMGDIPQALQSQFIAAGIQQETSDTGSEAALTLNMIGNIYMEIGDFSKAVSYYRASKNLFAKINKTGMVNNELSNIGNVYEMMGLLDSSKMYQQKVYDFSKTNTYRGTGTIVYGEMRERLGNVEARLGNYDTALMHYRFGILESITDSDLRNLAANYLHIARLFRTLQQYDSSFYYAKKAIETGKKVSQKKTIYEASGLLTSLFKLKNQPDSALVYAELSTAVKDSLYGQKTFQKLQLIILNEQQRQQQLQEEKDKLQYRFRMTALLATLGAFLLIAIILWRNNQRQKKANRLLNKQKELISSQRNDLEKTIDQLKTTQAQLIHSEKMASMGELTAGIAHEIQNPLNFVNNFSEVNAELIPEMKDALAKGNLEEAKKIADDIHTNEQKIVFHGKRADAIVKGMLQHSRSSNGVKEPTDINRMADEYLRLAYHGLRAKDKSFHATMKTDFDDTIGNISILPQDMGRVLLNLITNAFYAVTEKKKMHPANYDPTVVVSTRSITLPSGRGVAVSVNDNGMGIPPKILDKIYQPFFTTKPAGEGTGLGLSMSYTIITKGHGGELKVDTKEGAYTTFTLVLPIESKAAV